MGIKATEMDRALALARKAAALGEVPVGAVIRHKDGRIIAEAHNVTRHPADPTGHAEMLAIRQACKALNAERLDDCDLFVTLEPCAMCTGAIAHARIRRLYYGAADPKGGAVESGPRLFSQPTIHHKPDVYSGLREEEAAALLKAFFKERREAAGI